MGAGNKIMALIVAVPMVIYLVSMKQPATFTTQDESIAQAAGFKNADDYVAAKGFGISDPAKWSEQKAKMDQAAAAERERQLAAKMKKDEEDYERTRNPATLMNIKSLAWSKSGFGTVALLTLTVENMNKFAVKDIAISCDFSGNSGTKLNTANGTIFETIKASSSRSFKEFNIGFIHSQAARGGCSVESARRL